MSLYIKYPNCQEFRHIFDNNYGKYKNFPRHSANKIHDFKFASELKFQVLL